ncbi:hypothetical protein B296_00057618 [Ensete ventricosum]|uniref:Uncharacterized protein n=1 Tax=Ensete ventricosum TaxID=4639 RepID=A0A426X1X9_ENSVE|nr:hypothetical protein B296_00057618 [Ensete ventricosum]
MRLGTCHECIESLTRVSGVCQDSARESVRRRPRLVGRLSGVAEKLNGSIGLRIRRCEGSSLGDSSKGSSLGTRWEIAGGRP